MPELLGGEEPMEGLIPAVSFQFGMGEYPLRIGSPAALPFLRP